jgi:zinc transporter, ZIP family
MPFADLHPIVQALIGSGIDWAITALGALGVFFLRRPNQRLMDAMLGFAAGVMIAASFWSLLAPAIEMCRDMGMRPYLAPAIGFCCGGLFLWTVDKILPHLHLGAELKDAEGIRTPWGRSVLIVLAITLHNIPEGLAVGVAFGGAADLGTPDALAGAWALAIGIGIQDFPEGLAVALPLRRDGMSATRSFFFGQLSGVVEPIAAVIGATAVLICQPLLPYALSFAAGAMLFVCIEELVPESQRGGNADLATLGALGGFVVMMMLDVGFG